MALVTSKDMLLDAQKNGYAVGAFNIENMEMAQAVVDAAEEMRAPVILQTTPGTVKYADVDIYYAICAAMAKKVSVPVAVHLDHGNGFELAVQAVRAGYTSIMIDGSHESFEKNAEITGSVVAVAEPNGIPVEAELGRVGGKEDDLECAGGGYTDPIEAREFVDRTGVSSLAVGIGTAHGIYKGTPKLDILRLKEIRKAVSVPLVLHGASGLSAGDISACILEGICKVNFATELRVAFSDGVKKVLAESPDVFDPKKYCAAGRENVKQLVMGRMKVCGCVNRF